MRRAELTFHENTDPDEVKALLALIHMETSGDSNEDVHDFVHCVIEELFFGRPDTLEHLEEHHRFLDYRREPSHGG